MPDIYFICGFIGSGKTTYSKQLAKEKSAFRFSIDEWMIPLSNEHIEHEVFDERFATLQSLFKKAALQMYKLGVPVIFDFGFWTESDRQLMIAWAVENSLVYEIIYLDFTFEKCSERVEKRNAEKNKQSYEITPEMMALSWSRFEIPRDENIKIVT